MLERLIPNLMVEDVNQTVKFYQDILGCFELVITDPKEGKLDWAMMRCEDVEIMFQSRDSLVEKVPELKDVSTGGTAVIYIEAEDVEDIYDWVKDRVEVIKELHDTPWGRKEFFIKDCNGYILVFAQ
jgi:uncharacterized glyoxalase superfamily protein PhnB